MIQKTVNTSLSEGPKKLKCNFGILEKHHFSGKLNINAWCATNPSWYSRISRYIMYCPRGKGALISHATRLSSTRSGMP